MFLVGYLGEFWWHIDFVTREPSVPRYRGIQCFFDVVSFFHLLHGSRSINARHVILITSLYMPQPISAIIFIRKSITTTTWSADLISRSCTLYAFRYKSINATHLQLRDVNSTLTSEF